MDKKKASTPVNSSCHNCGARHDSVLCAVTEAVPAIEKAKVTCRFQAGQTVFYAGNDPIGIFSVQSGLVKLEVISPSGSAHTIRFVGPGGALGYRSLFASEPYHATAIAVEDCELCFIPKSDIVNLFKTHPEVAMRLMQHLSKDLRQAESKWLDQMDKGAAERVAEAILFLNDHFSHQGWTRKEIAQWAGTTPETVIRTLALFEKEGLIDQSEGREIHILDRQRLFERTSPKI